MLELTVILVLLYVIYKMHKVLSNTTKNLILWTQKAKDCYCKLRIKEKTTLILGKKLDEILYERETMPDTIIITKDNVKCDDCKQIHASYFHFGYLTNGKPMNLCIECIKKREKERE